MSRSPDQRPYDTGNEHGTASNPQSSHPTSSPSNPPLTVPDDDGPADTMPLSMSASVVLGALPTDAKTALERIRAEEGVPLKVRVRFTPVGAAPRVNPSVAKVSAANRFETVVNFLRRRLGLTHEDHVFCYVNSVFAPGLDEGVGGLYKCFKQGQGNEEQLVVAYAMTPAFG